MPGFPLMAFGAGLGKFAEQYAQQQAQRERTQMLQMQLQNYQQQQQDRQAWDRLTTLDPLANFKPVGMPVGGGGGGVPTPSPTTPRPPPASGGNRGDPVEHFLDLTERDESGSRNTMQQVIGPQGGYNPSVGRVTGPSSAQGYFQIITPTWQAFAPKAGVDLGQYPTAMSAPYEVQRSVARTIATTSGVQHWTDYNKILRANAERAGLPVTGRLAGGGAPGGPGQSAELPAVPDFSGLMMGNRGASYAPPYTLPAAPETQVAPVDPAAAYAAAYPPQPEAQESAAQRAPLQVSQAQPQAAPSQAAPSGGGLPPDAGGDTTGAAPAAPAGLSPVPETLKIPDLRQRINKIIPPTQGGISAMDLPQLKAAIDAACPGCPGIVKRDYLNGEVKRLNELGKAQYDREWKRYEKDLNVEKAQWEEDVKTAREAAKRTGGQVWQDKDGKLVVFDPNHPERGVAPVPGSQGLTRPGEKSEKLDWQLLTDPQSQEQYWVQKGRPETAIGMDGKPFKPTGAQKLGAGGLPTASAGREADLKAEIARLDNEFVAAHPDATPAEKAKAHTEHRLQAETKMTKARTSEARSSPTNMIMRKAMDEHPDWSSADILRYSNMVLAQQSIERRYGAGRGANDMTALNTVAHHLKLMTDYASALRTGDTPFTEIPRLNQIIQAAARERGLPEVTNFNIARDILADEVVRLLTSTGGTEADRAGMQSRLAPMMSEYQQTGALTALEGFVAGRFQALEQGYARNDPLRVKDFRENLLTPEARDVFNKHGTPQAGASPAAAPQAAPQQKPTAAGVPVPPGAAGDPDGTSYEKDGVMWVKRGNQLIPTPGAVRTQ